MYKKVYVEITNICNLKCSFCIHNKRESSFMSKDNFQVILEKLKPYTKYLYLHVMGEPLMHPYINEFINLASQYYFVNITTNGYLIDKIKNNKNIRQINISLHSFNDKYNKTLNEYLTDILEVTNILKEYTYINYRIWASNPYKKDIIKILEEYYNTTINGHTKLSKNTFIDFDTEFFWPDLSNNYYNEICTCYALKNHIAILVDGTIVPCCLDSKGSINLGNIFESSIEDIINSKRYQKMLINFKNNKRCEELCKHCNFLDR